MLYLNGKDELIIDTQSPVPQHSFYRFLEKGVDAMPLNAAWGLRVRDFATDLKVLNTSVGWFSPNGTTTSRIVFLRLPDQSSIPREWRAWIGEELHVSTRRPGYMLELLLYCDADVPDVIKEAMKAEVIFRARPADAQSQSTW